MANHYKIKKATKKEVYKASAHIGQDAQKDLGLQIPFDVYLQDPLVAREDPLIGFDNEFYIAWEPNIADGPTSSRFAVVDFDGDTGRVEEKARWDEERLKFLSKDGVVLDTTEKDSYQFHQVNVWAILQRSLAIFEHGDGLGRPVPFAFEGNRLIVVPHAGYGKNAFYDRKSKSLQFYYFNNGEDRVYTCLSTDIIHHEFGHAIFDGIRPYYMESSLQETAAFHEFIGDLVSLLFIFSNNKFRNELAERTGGDLGSSNASVFRAIADEFGKAITGRPYLRSMDKPPKMSEVKDIFSPHEISQVLTGAMFEILKRLVLHYIDRGSTVKRSMYFAQRLMLRICIQPLDLLPPVDGTFKDYAFAVLKSQQLSNPIDPYGQNVIIRKVFIEKEIITESEAAEFESNKYAHEELTIDYAHDIEKIARSRAAAYKFLDDNRDALLIPKNQNLIVADLYDSNKFTRKGIKLPRQIILEYIWKEEHLLDGEKFGEFNGERIVILCGGTLVFDQGGAVQSWFRKPGTFLELKEKTPKKERLEENKNGICRRDSILSNLANRIQRGDVGVTIGSKLGMVGSFMSSMQVVRENGILQFTAAPHLHVYEDDHQTEKINRWEISS